MSQVSLPLLPVGVGRRLVAIAVAFAVGAWLPGCDYDRSMGATVCGDGECKGAENKESCPEDCLVLTPQPLMPQSDRRDVDILLVVDNSPSMENEQQHLRTQFVALIHELKQMPNGLPGVHIGVVTADLGVGSFTTIRYCAEEGGDRGVLGKVGTQNTADTCIGSGQR
jgi:hypothetical protein